LNRLASLLYILVLFLLMPVYALANASTNTVVLKVGDKHVQVDGTTQQLNTAPRIMGSTTMVPLRFLSEAFGAKVAWQQELQQITVEHDSKVLVLYPGKKQVLINGNSSMIDAAPEIREGTALVPLRLLIEAMNYAVEYEPKFKVIHITQLPPPNQPPVAVFNLSKTMVAQGETVIYEDKSYDPEGDEIIERKWSGNERAFFKPGQYKVSLTVKDRPGNTSETYTATVRVTDEVRMDQLTYNLHNPIRGAIVDISGIAVASLRTFDPAVTYKRENIVVSNSPETITEDGILYCDEISGDNRLYYHHFNGSKEPKRVYLLASNERSTPAKLWLLNWGTAGPGDPMVVGKRAAYRYLDSNKKAQVITINPGEKIIINKDINNTIGSGETMHGIFDVSSDNKLLFSMVAVSDQDPIADYESLAMLPRDGKHVRGTFPRGQRSFLVQLPELQKPERLVIADGREDAFLYGEDKNTLNEDDENLKTFFKGNYGLVYSIGIRAKQRVGVIFSPRGGPYAGAARWDNEPFNLSNIGTIKAGEGALVGVVNPGEKNYFTFIPPAGSFLPVNLIFVPF